MIGRAAALAVELSSAREVPPRYHAVLGVDERRLLRAGVRREFKEAFEHNGLGYLLLSELNGLCTGRCTS